MKSKFVSLILLGTLVQLAALIVFCVLAKLKPESAWKFAGLLLLGLGSVAVIKHMAALPQKLALIGLVLLSMAAPVVLGLASMALSGLMKDVDFLSAEHFETAAKIAGLAFACYVLTWGTAVLLTRSKRRVENVPAPHTS